MKSVLRPRQKKAIDDLRASLASGRKRPILQAPTGFGKTQVFASIAEMALEKGSRVVFCAPAISLINQTIDRLHSEGITEVGAIQADHPLTDWSRPIQVCSVQTLMRRGRPDAQLWVVDECHRQFKYINRLCRDPDMATIPIIGLSATPWSRGLGKYYDDLIVAARTSELISEGWLSPFRVFAPSHPDLSGVKTVAGDYHEGQLSSAVNRANLIADIVSTWIELGENRPTMCFAVDRAHAKHIQRDFEDAGIGCGYIDALTPPEERDALRDKLEAGEIRVVSSVGCLIIGVDWPFVSCIIWARPTKSEMLFVQGTGRGLRTHPGKENCLILDHSDNHARLGFVTDIHHETLDMGESGARKPKEAPTRLPKECPKCHYLRPVGVRECPACGFVPEKSDSVEVEDGELREITPGAKRKKKTAYTRDEMQSWYGSLLQIAWDRGYKDGWAANQFKEKFGSWPNGLTKWPEEPLPEVRSWVRHKQIKWAKRRANGEEKSVAGA